MPPANSTLNGTVSPGIPALSLWVLVGNSLIRFSVYLTGATLFLSLILSRVFYIILDFINVQESYTKLRQTTAKNSGAAGEGDELRKRIKQLESELSASQGQGRDFGA